MTEEILNTLATFTQEEWDVYLYRLCHQESVEPTLDFVADNLAQRIFWIHDGFLEKDPAKIANLVDAIVRTLRSIVASVSTTETIHVLLNFVFEVRPISQRKSILSLIKTGRFSDLYYGEDNLYLLLLRAYIPLENEHMEAEEYYLRLKYEGDGYYYLYLQIDYYCALSKEQQALNLIAKMLSESFGDNEVYNFIVENVLVDQIPLPLSYLHLAKILVENNVKVCKHWQFKKTIRTVSDFWKANTGLGLEGQLLFLEDILLSSEYNGRENPWFLEEMSKHSKLLRHLINTYYGDLRAPGEIITIDDYIEQTFTSLAQPTVWII